MSEEKTVPRCFMCGNVERDGVALVRPAERTDLWYDGCHAGFVELQPKARRGRCQWCSGGWLQSYGVYSCNCEEPCGCPECSATRPEPESEEGEFVVTALIDAHLWDSADTRVLIVESMSNRAIEEATSRGWSATLPGEITVTHPAVSAEGRTHPEIGPDQLLVSLRVALASGARS